MAAGRYRSRTYLKDGKQVRQCTRCGVTKVLTSANWGKSSNDDTGFRRQCKPCVTEMNKNRGRGSRSRSKAQPEQKQGGTMGGTAITCACGHVWTYTVERPSMLDHLKKKPCPACAAKGMQQQTPEQREKQAQEEQAQEEERQQREAEAKKKADEERKARIDHAWVERIIDMLPDGELFHRVLTELLMALDAGLGAIWLQGPPGTSKSTLAEQAARGLGMNFYPMSCHELMTRSDLFGFTDATGNDHRTPLWDAYEFGGILLMDEVDNGNPNLLAALNSALSNGHCVFGSGTVVQRHENFRVVATANTAGLGPEHGYIGRNGVDLATRDRFITLDVPIDSELEAALGAMYMGEDISDLVEELFQAGARQRLEQRSIDREEWTATQLVTVVSKLRAAVDQGSLDSRFRGQVVSPRTTIHVGPMLKAGFTMREALKAKLPGLKASEVTTVIEEAIR